MNLIPLVLRRLLRRSRLLCRLRFGVDVPVKVLPGLWDQTTPVLMNAIGSQVLPGMHILEVGTGQAALLLCWLAKSYPKYGLTLMGAEINSHFAKNARVVASANNARIEIIMSDLFERIDGKFDLIFINPPYVPLSHPAVDKQSSDPMDTTWDGGPQGIDVISGFLDEAYRFLVPGGIINLGVNEFYISGKLIRELVNEKGYKITKVVQKFGNQSRVYVLSRRDKGKVDQD
tara:strand:- start:1624 stop:2316 length:693 start_codon:yes stop_codon:yes gene_type:complete